MVCVETIGFSCRVGIQAVKWIIKTSNKERPFLFISDSPSILSLILAGPLIEIYTGA